MKVQNRGIHRDKESISRSVGPGEELEEVGRGMVAKGYRFVCFCFFEVMKIFLS